jgi:hypothetical protein
MAQVTVSESTFGLQMRVVVGGCPVKAALAAKRYTDCEVSNPADLAGVKGWTLHHEDRAFIWLESWPESDEQDNLMTLVHECVHVAMSFLRDHVGEDIRKAEETCCYLVQRLAAKTARKLNRKLST